MSPLHWLVIFFFLPPSGLSSQVIICVCYQSYRSEVLNQGQSPLREHVGVLVVGGGEKMLLASSVQGARGAAEHPTTHPWELPSPSKESSCPKHE